MSGEKTVEEARRAAECPLDKMADRLNGRPRLIVLCGPSHCGKSTLAKSLPGQVVSSDEIRSILGRSFSRDDSRLWSIFEHSKRLALKLDSDVILDACHLSRRSRRHSVQNAEGYYKILVIFDIKPSVLLARARKEHRTPLVEVRRMAREFERPTIEEAAELGFDQIQVIDDIGNNRGAEEQKKLQRAR